MLKPQQSGSSGRKTSNGTSGLSSMSSSASGINVTNSRAANGRSRNSVKTPHQSSPGSTCDIRVKNGSVYEGIFKTLSSRCELAVDAVHRRCEEGSNSSAPPRREEITDTMIFSPSDLVTMTCRDVDLNYATRDSFTDTAISSVRVNGEHKEKVLQRWEGGDANGESYDLEADTSNGWDANEMFRFNEENYGIKSTYDSSLSMYTMPLERGSSEGFRQREARAARLASEIESSPQYRHRVSLENEEGKTEEEKFSAVVRDRDGGDRERGRESPRERERERGRDSPNFSSGGSREGKYIPLPQRARDMGVSGNNMRGERERGERGSGGGNTASVPNRMGGYHSSRPCPPNSSPRPPLPTSNSQSTPSSERNSPLSNRGGYSPHHPQNSPSSGTAYTPPTSLSNSSSGNFSGSSSRLSEPPAASPAPPVPSHTSPPTPHTHNLPIPHSLTHPQSLSESTRPVNGVSSRTSPKSQRPLQTSRTLRTPSSHTTPAASRSPKASVSPQEAPGVPAAPYLDTTSVTMANQKPAGPAPLFTVDVSEILSSAGKERAAESPLQPSTGGSNNATTAVSVPAETPQPSVAQSSPVESATASEPKQSPALNPSQPRIPSSPSEEPGREKEAEGADGGNTSTAQMAASDAQSPATPQPARTPGSEEPRVESTDRGEGVTDQVKKSTLNPNAKEFNPNKPPMTLSKPSSAPTPPRPTPPSPSVVLQPPPGQAPIYNAPYLSYVSQIHSVQAPPMYQYTMSTISQGKYTRAKGSVVAPRSDHSSSAPPMIQAAASAAGPPLVASPYPQSYLQYSPQQYNQQVIQAMTHYPGQPMYSMLQSGARMLGSGGGHPQPLGPPGGPQFPGQGEGPPGPQQGLYAPQSFTHHSGSMHPPQPSSTPTGNQPPPQHAAPSPSQLSQAPSLSLCTTPGPFRHQPLQPCLLDTPLPKALIPFKGTVCMDTSPSPTPTLHWGSWPRPMCRVPCLAHTTRAPMVTPRGRARVLSILNMALPHSRAPTNTTLTLDTHKLCKYKLTLHSSFPSILKETELSGRGPQARGRKQEKGLGPILSSPPVPKNCPPLSSIQG
ncbi:hypothetical protein JZ751_026365 [Albula glossodonta]|uniref:LsmAD domain-containing protein n=1 Tax=Albula glossodonta TaxID=121402 RepID=A0A8T2PK26_9TELE|nr:hypothetical protein JZ751_026365 [Albula glossodonta]